jgi:hypothetical protein
LFKIQQSKDNSGDICSGKFGAEIK